MASVLIKVVGWDDESVWTKNVAWARNSMIKMLRESTPMGITDAKRLIRGVLAKEVDEILLAGCGKTFFQPLRSIGASVRDDLKLARKLHLLRSGQANSPCRGLLLTPLKIVSSGCFTL